MPKNYFRFISGFFVVTLFLSSFLFTQNAFACSCSVASEFDYTLRTYPGSVFVGTVQSLPENQNTNGAGKRAVAFKVNEKFKNVTDETIVVYTSVSSASCGYDFSSSKQYLVYAETIDGQLTTGLCSGTKLASEAQGEIQKIREAQNTLIPGIQNDTLLPYVAGLIAIILIAIIALVVGLIKTVRDSRKTNEKYRPKVTPKS